MPAKTRRIARDASTGEIVTLAEAKRRPESTVIETVEIRTKAPKSKSEARRIEVQEEAKAEKTAADLEAEAAFARKAQTYRTALFTGHDREIPYGDPLDPQWPKVRAAVEAQLDAEGGPGSKQ